MPEATKFSRITGLFLRSSAVLLFLPALAKLVSSAGTAHYLRTDDPIFGIPFRTLFWCAGAIEIIVAFVCLVGKNTSLRAGLVAWLSSVFVLYRVGLFLIGYHKPCPCLGNLTDAIHISANTADMVLMPILAYLLIGSYAVLIWCRRQKLNTLSPTLSGGAPRFLA